MISGISNDCDWDNTDNNPFNFGYLGELAGVLLTICPDGLSYHFPIGYYWDVAPYTNILGIDWVFNRKENYSKLKYAVSLGTKVCYSFSNNMTVNVFLETRKVTSTGLDLAVVSGLSTC